MLSHPSPQGVRGILAALSLSMLLSSLGISIANVGLPALATAFHASFQAVQWVLLCYLLAVTTCIIGIGRLGDSLNRRRLLLAGIALFTAASLACALAPQLWLLLAARLAQGLGGAVMMSIAMALAGEVLGKEKIGRAMGLLGTMSAVGTALGPSLGGALIAGFGWRAMFLINLPLGLLALWLAWRYLPNGPRAATRAEPFDRAGTLLLGGALLCYSLAMTLGRGDFGTLNLALMLGALLAGALFIRVERRAASPLLAPSMFRHPALTAGLAASALVMTVMTATLVVGPFYLSRALGLSAAQVGLVMSAGPAVAILTGIPAGYLVDRFGSQRIAQFGLTAVAAGAALLSLFNRWGVLGYIAPIALLTAGYALFQVANNTMLMKDLFPERRGLIAGMVNLSRNLGAITGASTMGALFYLASQQVAGTVAAAAYGMRVTYGVAALLALAALIIAFGGRRLMLRYGAR
ncbi:Spectinomycin tetracycline efflux pump [Serratia marcescens]|uniref:MFS transporter n=1 Tax=Serratia marcescens TaxID=615 RepID=UPI002177DCF3|nr:MFS transporter [Serratia marcescens]CAI0770043.1 Spectinomycin tetracycline efflux pump [Serratia marcescens]CAI0846298.1 Spectinomycin tetracycline efflux pump [Serratia marcescens]CAI1663540.1 Spectinomycin tetracycline efflux pump [Serratia marcescens]CAI1718572.1 Spectinomycin tetracycline efflux pump [Serratia marcescens]